MKVSIKRSPLLDANLAMLKTVREILAQYSPAEIELALYMTTEEGRAEMDRVTKALEK